MNLGQAGHTYLDLSFVIWKQIGRKFSVVLMLCSTEVPWGTPPLLHSEQLSCSLDSHETVGLN